MGEGGGVFSIQEDSNSLQLPKLSRTPNQKKNISHLHFLGGRTKESVFPKLGERKKNEERDLNDPKFLLCTCCLPPALVECQGSLYRTVKSRFNDPYLKLTMLTCMSRCYCTQYSAELRSYRSVCVCVRERETVFNGWCQSALMKRTLQRCFKTFGASSQHQGGEEEEREGESISTEESGLKPLKQRDTGREGGGRIKSVV